MHPMPEHAWVFFARLIRVVDGDTVDLEIDTAMHSRRIERLRLVGIDAPEVRGVSKEAGLAATAFVREWFVGAVGEWPLLAQTFKSDAFGRYLALIYRRWDGSCLNDDLLASGHAVVYQ